MLSLVISKGGNIIESGRISWSPQCEKSIIPNRPSDREWKGVRIWRIAPDKRRLFAKHVVGSLEKMNAKSGGNKNTEELYGFFELVGLGKRWVDVMAVDWWLASSNQLLTAGKILGKG